MLRAIEKENSFDEQYLNSYYLLVLNNVSKRNSSLIISVVKLRDLYLQYVVLPKTKLQSLYFYLQELFMKMLHFLNSFHLHSVRRQKN